MFRSTLCGLAVALACLGKLSSTLAMDDPSPRRELALGVAAGAFLANDVNHDQRLDRAEQSEAAGMVQRAVENSIRETMNDPRIQWQVFMHSRIVPVLISGPDGFVDGKVLGNYAVELFEAADAATREELLLQSQWSDYQQYRMQQALIFAAEQAAALTRQDHEQSEDAARHERHRMRRHLFDPAAKRRSAEALAKMEKLSAVRLAAEREVHQLKETLAKFHRPEGPPTAEPPHVVHSEPPVFAGDTPPRKPVLVAHRDPAADQHRQRVATEQERESQRQIEQSVREQMERANREFAADRRPQPPVGRPPAATPPAPRNLFDESRRELRAAASQARDERTRQEQGPAESSGRDWVVEERQKRRDEFLRQDSPHSETASRSDSGSRSSPERSTSKASGSERRSESRRSEPLRSEHNDKK